MLRIEYFVIVLALVAQLTACAQEPSRDELIQYSHLELTVEEEESIESLIDQLVFSTKDTSDEPMVSPGVKDKSPEYTRRFKKVQDAFESLTKLKARAFPVLVKHLDDKRHSINFRNHTRGNSVGDACMWNIYFQLQDRPKGYSKYGYDRKGKDGKHHPKPYWEGTPFDDVGGIANWLEQNKELTYPEMQIKCLNWLLDREKTIGACDPESYFENIVPLEIQILKRQSETGADVKNALTEKEKALQNRDPSIIPPELLPPK